MKEQDTEIPPGAKEVLYSEVAKLKGRLMVVWLPASGNPELCLVDDVKDITREDCTGKEVTEKVIEYTRLTGFGQGKYRSQPFFKKVFTFNKRDAKKALLYLNRQRLAYGLVERDFINWKPGKETTP